MFKPKWVCAIVVPINNNNICMGSDIYYLQYGLWKLSDKLQWVDKNNAICYSIANMNHKL